MTLKDKIEELICAGRLLNFVKVDQSERSPVRGKNPRRESPRRRSPPRGEGTRKSYGHNDRYDCNDRPRRDRSRSRSRGRSDNCPLRGMINTISGGFVGGGLSSATWKRHVRVLRSIHAVNAPRKTMSPITFTDEDFHAPNPDQDDSMVITVEIARYGVSKVLIDQGSSVNILYWKTFQQMDISEDLIVSYNEQIGGS